MYHAVQVSKGVAEGPTTSHIARVIATLSPDARDGVAYLSPFLAHNLGLQLHLEQFLSPDDGATSQSGQNSETDDRLESNARGSTSGSAGMGEDHSPEQLFGGGRKVRVAPLEALAQQAGFGALLQPGRIPGLSSFDCIIVHCSANNFTLGDASMIAFQVSMSVKVTGKSHVSPLSTKSSLQPLREIAELCQGQVVACHFA